MAKSFKTGITADGTVSATSLAVTGEFTLPTADGSADQVLVTDGSGTVSWAAQSGGSGSPGGSDGQVQYNNGGAFGGASGLHYDDANNRVGIGTTSPAQALEVEGQVVIGAGDDITPDGTGNGHLKIDGNTYSSFFTMDGTGTWIGNNSNSRSMILATDETARLTVSGTGNVGIGTTSPAEELHMLKDQDGVLTQMMIENIDQRLRVGAYYEAGVNQYSKIQSEADNGSDQRLALNPEGGNVGIGTTTPAESLSVDGNIDLVGPARTVKFGSLDEGGPHGLEVAPSGTLESALYYRTSPLSWSFEDGSGGKIAEFVSGTLSTAFNTDTLYVDGTNDRVGIGTTSPDATLDVAGDIYFNNNALVASDAGSSNIDHIWHDEAANAWNFVSDSTYKAAGNSAIVAGSFSGNGANLTSVDASTLGGLSLKSETGTPGANSVIRSASNGYTYFGWINTTSGSTTSTISRIYASNDAFVRYVTPATFRSQVTDPHYLLNTSDTLSGNLTVTGNVTAQGDLYVGKNGGGDSRIYFYDDNSNANRVFYWDDSANRFDLGGTTRINGSATIENKLFVQGNGSDLLRLRDTGGTDTGGYISFEQSAGTRMGYIGYGNNDDIHIKNDNSGGNIYFGVQAGWALQIDTSRNLLPYTDNTHSLGGSGRAWNHFYLHQGNQFSSGGYWTLRSRDSDRQVMELVSSERFKRDIVDMPTEEAYQVLDARVIKYRGIDDDDTVPLEAGLSAESLHNAGYEYAVRYDEGHWGETPRSIYYEYLTVPLIKICQDQKERIESLESRLAALEAG